MFVEFIVSSFTHIVNSMFNLISSSSWVATPGAWAANFGSLLLTGFHFFPYDVFALFVSSFLFWLGINFMVYLYKFILSLIPVV